MTKDRPFLGSPSHVCGHRLQEVRIEAFLRRVRIIPVFSNIARIAGDLRRLYPRLKGFDSAVAATALFANSTLVTRNIRDFEQIEGLSLLAI